MLLVASELPGLNGLGLFGTSNSKRMTEMMTPGART